jgi:hypothetical protein
VTPKVVIFVGTEDDTFEDRLYGQIALDNMEIIFWSSVESLEGLSPSDFLYIFGQAANASLLVSRQLCLEIVVDDSVEELATDLSEEVDIYRKAIQMLRGD